MSAKDPIEGASVVVLGGSAGIGLATAVLAARAGALVTIAARDPARLAAARDAIGGGVRALPVDVTDEHAVRDLFEGLDRVDHVADLAGPSSAGPIATGDIAGFRSAVDVRLWGAVYTCRYAAPKMPAGGSITLCSGLAAHRPRAGRSIAAASTAAVESFARAMALELAPIRVNAICPGPVETPRLDREFGEDRDRLVASLEERLPVRRIGKPEDLAHAILFLMRNGFVTGITLPVDGGAMLI